ncbi:MAG TPA: GGDEF domain-containing protein [Syntrophomonadaceae bacterium]|nr:GGDEF domain-containing protein [Syntrophomonadaceae bacterium]
MNSLYNLVNQNRDFLSKRTIFYAQNYHFAAYAPILPQVWQTALNEMVDAFLSALDGPGLNPPLDFYDNYSRDPLCAFGILEAQKQRHRGVTLELFLGLIKYFRQAFRDLIQEQQMGTDEERSSGQLIERFFDRVEIGVCLDWTGEHRDELIKNMQDANLELAYEKNKYLAIFESISNPVILLNQQHLVENMNYAAVDLLMSGNHKVPDDHALNNGQIRVEHLMPWLVEEVFEFISSNSDQATIEKEILLSEDDRRHLVIKFHRLIDISDRFKGTVLILNDVTEAKQAEEALRYMSFHDELTGLFNRAYFEQEMLRLENGRSDPLGIISFDVDGLKLVNDVLGHQAGDLLLAAAASVIHQCFRENDVVARIGGDEFAVLLPNSQTEDVERAAQRTREAVESHNKDNPHLPLSLSQGWAVRDDLSTSLSRIYQQADHQMYREKPWNREVFHQRFLELYKQFGNELYNHDLITTG